MPIFRPLCNLTLPWPRQRHDLRAALPSQRSPTCPYSFRRAIHTPPLSVPTRQRRSGRLQLDPSPRLEPAPGAIRQRSPKAPPSCPRGLDQSDGRGYDATACSVNLKRRCLNVVDRFRGVRPLNRNMATAAVRIQNEEKQAPVLPANLLQNFKRLALEQMRFAPNPDPCRKITEVGSASGSPSAAWTWVT